MFRITFQIFFLANIITQSYSLNDYIDIFNGPGANTGRPPLIMPDMTSITNKISRNDFFIDRNPTYQSAVAEVQNILGGMRDKADLVQMMGQLRNYSELHPRVWLRAVMKTIVQRDDRASFLIPKLIEIQPDLMLPNHIIEQVRLQSSYPSGQRKCVAVDGSLGRDNGRENILWYFREDVSINSHHWFWHLYYPIDAKEKKDRRGEVFYYMHHNMLARYNIERIAHSLPPITAFEYSKHGIYEEGYHAHLTDLTSKQNWTDRPPRTPIPDKIRMSSLSLDLDDLLAFHQRILTSIDNGFLLSANGAQVPILNIQGVDLVGNVQEANVFSVNPPFYGKFGYHNSGHLFAGNSLHPIDPTDFFPHGVMSDTAVAMRDMLFYKWHTNIDNLYGRHKNTLKPYQPKTGELALSWTGVYVEKIEVNAIPSPSVPNQLKTFWSTTKYDLTNGLDFLRNQTAGKVHACVKHLNHQEFVYNLKIRNTNNPTKATVRIFMAPRYSNAGVRFSMEEQRLLFITMDVFRVNLVKGDNHIIRQSTDSTLTITLNQGLEELNVDQTRSTVHCGCGWPSYMLLPRGKSSGMIFDLFVMVTSDLDGNSIPFLKPNDAPSSQRMCEEAYLYCGSFNGKYPDVKPMGYPFDRQLYTVIDYSSTSSSHVRLVKDLDEYMKPMTNMGSTQIQIVHLDVITPSL